MQYFVFQKPVLSQRLGIALDCRKMGVKATSLPLSKMVTYEGIKWFFAEFLAYLG
jgi:hypothetical protein